MVNQVSETVSSLELAPFDSVESSQESFEGRRTHFFAERIPCVLDLPRLLAAPCERQQLPFEDLIAAKRQPVKVGRNEDVPREFLILRFHDAGNNIIKKKCGQRRKLAL